MSPGSQRSSFLLRTDWDILTETWKGTERLAKTWKTVGKRDVAAESWSIGPVVKSSSYSYRRSKFKSQHSHREAHNLPVCNSSSRGAWDLGLQGTCAPVYTPTHIPITINNKEAGGGGVGETGKEDCLPLPKTYPCPSKLHPRPIQLVISSKVLWQPLELFMNLSFQGQMLWKMWARWYVTQRSSYHPDCLSSSYLRYISIRNKTLFLFLDSAEPHSVLKA